MQLNNRLFLVSAGPIYPASLSPPHAFLAQSGLVLGETLANGRSAQLVIQPPGDDIVAYADMACVSILKPACLPLQLTYIEPQRIEARIRKDAFAAQFAMAVLKTLATFQHPLVPPGKNNRR